MSAARLPHATTQQRRDRAVNEAMVALGGPASQARLPRVLHDVPAAVLLLDVASCSVVHANPAASALVQPGVALPVPAARWAQLAGLHTPWGQPEQGGASALERAARGEPIFGEAVAVQTPDGARTLWASAFPLPNTEESLVVLFEVDGVDDGAAIRDRAVLAAGLSFTISDPTQPDTPLVYVNPAFERTTGYSAAEAVGRNCRFLQGPDTDPAAVDAVRELLEQEQHGVVTLLNYRKDGTAFWNELSLSPVYDGTGALTHFVGIQADVTTRVLGEQERDRHLALEQAARADAERAQRRLALLAEATSMLAATLDAEESLARLTALVVPLLADWCTIDLVAAGGELRRVASAHVDPTKQPLLDLIEQLQPQELTDDAPVSQVLRGAPPLLFDVAPGELVAQSTHNEELAAAYRELGVGSAMVVPLRAHRRVLGALSLVTSSSGRRYDEDDLVVAADLARRAAMTVDNARLYQREHDVAEALQRSLLPSLPQVPGLDCAARYLPSGAGGQVGGDWYDLLPLPDGAIGLAIGDVMGHDLTAAAAMGQLRSVLRSYAWQGDSPAVVLDHLDQLVQGLGMAQLATAIYCRLHLTPGEPALLRYANAGHLPPALRAPDGTVRFLRDGRSLLVGAAVDIERSQAQESLEPGSVLVFYTDGLVEDRELDIDDGLAALAQTLAQAPDGSAESLCTALTEALTGGERDDDIAILVVKVL